jgi:hypothetical protein
MNVYVILELPIQMDPFLCVHLSDKPLIYDTQPK